MNAQMELPERVSAWIESGQSVKAALPKAGRRIMDRVCKVMALREAARQTGLSPTYLSRVWNGITVVSPEAYLKLSRLLDSEPVSV